MAIEKITASSRVALSAALRPPLPHDALDRRTPLQHLGARLAAAHGIIDLASVVAEQVEWGDKAMIDQASVRRALREAARHIAGAEAIAAELPEVANG